MLFKLSGPGSMDITQHIAGLLDAAKLACEAYAQKAVKEMQAMDNNAETLQRRRQKLENEVRVLEERKRKALAHPKQDMRKGTKPLTPEEQAAHQLEVEAKREKAKAEAAARRESPLKHKPFATLAEVEAE